MKTPQTILVFLVLLTLTLLNTSCVKRDIDKISEAQDCLDQSTSATSLACLEKVDGLQSPSASLIRCSAYYIDQGFAEPTRLAEVAEQVTNESGDPADNTFAALAAMGFVATKYTMAQNYALSETAFGECSQSKSGGLIYLSSMTRISTALLNDLGFLVGGGDPDPAQIEAELCTSPSDATKTAIGAAAIVAYNNDCIGRDTSTDDVCQQYATALAVSSDPLVVGGLLADNLCP